MVSTKRNWINTFLLFYVIPKWKIFVKLKRVDTAQMCISILTVCMDKDLSVYKSHQITEFIEKELYDEFAISFIDIHVEPYQF